MSWIACRLVTGCASLVWLCLVSEAQVAGQLDTAFNFADRGFEAGYNVSGHAHTCLVQPDDRILVALWGGGEYDGLPAESVFRLTPLGVLDTSFSSEEGFNDVARPGELALQSDGKILVGGQDMTSFNGVPCNYIVRLHPNGELDTTYWSVNLDEEWGADHLSELSVMPDDRIFVGGDFTAVDGTPRHCIARLLPDGMLDTTFNAGQFEPDARVTAISPEIGGGLLVGGHFQEVVGVPMICIARLQSDGGLDTSFHSAVLTLDSNPGSISDIAVQSDGRIIIVGQFTTVEGAPRCGVARLLSTGALDTTFQIGTGFTSDYSFLATVSDVQIAENGSIYLAGDFTSFQDTFASGVIRLDPNGTRDWNFETGKGVGDGIGPGVHEVLRYLGGDVLIVGAIDRYDGLRASGIARIRSDGSLDLNFDRGTGVDWDVSRIVMQPDGKTVLGGWFTRVNGTPRSHLTRMNTDGSIDASFDCGDVLATKGPASNVKALALQADGRILVGGWRLGPDLDSEGIRRFLPDGSLDEEFHIPVSGTQNMYYCITPLEDGKILVGGSFNSYDGPSSCIVRLLSNGEVDPTFDTGSGFIAGDNVDARVYDIAVQPDGRIIAVGTFLSYDWNPVNGIARLNPDGSFDPTFDPGMGFLELGQAPDYATFWLRTVALDASGSILVGGGFDSFDYTEIHNLVRLTPGGVLDTTFQPDLDQSGVINDLLPQADGKWLAAGWGNLDGWSFEGLVRLNPDGSRDETFDIGTGMTGADGEGYATSLAFGPQGSLMVGGSFVSYNGIGRNNIARLFTDVGGIGMPEVERVDSSFLYPNPLRSGPLYVHSPGFDWDQFELHDGTGRLLVRRQIAQPNNGVDRALGLGDIADGSYLITVSRQGMRKTFRIVVSR